jgi:hypothetical protein
MARTFVLIVSFIFCTYINATSVTDVCTSRTCIAVVDAGSTGSRLHIYAFDELNNQIENITEVYAKKVQPGIASVDANPKAIYQYLNLLFKDASEKTVPVYFYATAGMRLLPPNQQLVYYDHIREWFSTNHKLKLQVAKTISGKEEGLLGWLSVNYLLGAFSSNGPKPVGVLDTGGASVQITFPISENTAVSAEDEEYLNVNGHSLHLFAHSFLGLGQTEVDHQFMDVIECFSNNYIVTNGTTAHGDLSACEKQVSVLVNAVHHVGTTVKSILIANPVERWYGIGGIGYIVQAAPMAFQKNEFTMQGLATQANRDICQTDWDMLNTRYSTNSYLFSSCLNSAYYYALVVNGYGLQPTQPIQYFPASQNGGDWTLGVVLRHGSK